MAVVNVHQAKTHLSRLIQKAVRGESIVISKAGRPMVRVTAIEAPIRRKRLGFLVGEIQVPKDFDRMGAETIATLFRGKP
jgi:prevent-host-death family protein